MDNFSAFPTTPTSPARSAATVVPNDASTLPYVSRALYIGQGGTLSVEMVDGQIVTFEAVPTGCLLPLRVGKVNATGTTAAAIISLW